MFENYVVLIILMLYVQFIVRTCHRHDMCVWKQAKCVKTEAEPKQMASACVLVQFGLHNSECLTQSDLCNPETSFPTPFVDFQRGDLYISDYIIWFLHIIPNYVL